MQRRIVLAGIGLLAVTMMAFAGLRSGESTPSAQAAGLLPAGWPTTLQLGSSDSPGGAAALKASAPYGFRYQYLAGGVNTGNGWSNWNANGDFAKYYIQDSVANGLIPVFSYYQIFQSSPGATTGESSAVYANLQNTSTMNAYYNDLKLFFQKAGAFPTNKVVLQVEPDMWGYLQQRSSGDNAGSVLTKVAGSGMADVAGFPDTAAGMAKAIVKLRDQYAPNVLLGYHLSIWGTGIDIQYSKTDDPTTDALATRAGNFYTSLGANFDISFAEFSDRDAGFKQAIYGDGGASWFSAADFARHARFLKTFSTVTQKRLVLWQIPLGNTKMQAQNNTWNHYQDNRVEWLLDDAGRAHLQTYIDAGVVAFLFGGGAGGVTCACDAAGDGVTNPAAINGNTLTSLTADDDGGFFKQKVSAYYAAGPMLLSGSGPAPTATPTSVPATSTPTRTPTSVPPTATPTNTPVSIPPTATPTAAPPPPTAGWTTSASTSSTSVARGSRITLSARATSGTATRALVDLEVYSSGGQKVYQRVWDNQSFSAGVQRTFNNQWTVPTNLAPGVYTIKVGIFGTGWNGLLSWNNNAATFTVR